MRIITLFCFALLLNGCGGGVSCVEVNPDTGEETCTYYEYSTSCPDGKKQVENCDAYN